jgi:hypothetical protein
MRSRLPVKRVFQRSSAMESTVSLQLTASTPPVCIGWRWTGETEASGITRSLKRECPSRISRRASVEAWACPWSPSRENKPPDISAGSHHLLDGISRRPAHRRGKSWDGTRSGPLYSLISETCAMSDSQTNSDHDQQDRDHHGWKPGLRPPHRRQTRPTRHHCEWLARLRLRFAESESLVDRQ